MEEIFNKIRKYNGWDGQFPETGFERSFYLSKISGFIGNRLVKVLTGQRRTGKSYLMRQIMQSLIGQIGVNPQNIFYLNKEFSASVDIKTSVDLENLFVYYKKQLNVSGKIYLFLDEIQNVDKWEVFVNSYSQDFTQEYELFISGSNSNLLSGELASFLSGRYVEFEILPFSLYEFAALKKLEISRDVFLDYLRFGGLPELFHLEMEEVRRYYVESLKNTIILRDIVGRHNIKDLSLLEDTFNFLMTNTGNLTSISSIVSWFKSRQKKTNYETLSSYIGYLKDTFVVHQVERYNLRGKQVLGGEFKYYLNDLAFKNFLSGFFPEDIGHHLENYIYIQLRRMGFNVRVGLINNLEIDFVAEVPGRKLYVQVCYMLNSQKVFDREFGNLLQIKDNYEKVVISLDEMKFSDYEGIKHLRPWELG